MKNEHELLNESGVKIVRPKWMRVTHHVFWIALTLLALMYCYLTFDKIMLDNDTFYETFHIVQSDKIDAPVRAVHLTDLHQKEYGKNNKYLLSRVRALEPDLICITGDMLTYGKDGYEQTYRLCEALADIAPTYYALGNHELSEILFNHVDMKARLAEAGVTLLNDAYVMKSVNGNSFVIGGLSRDREGIEQYAPDFMEDFVSRDGFRLLLTHYPANFDGYIESAPIDLALCGHEHGGIVRLPILGALYSQSQGLFPKLTEGKMRLGNSTVIIGRGLGDSSFFPRVNNPPELVVVDFIGNIIDFHYE